MTDSVLTERQKALLQAIGKDAWLRERFYLSGGTALAGFYLHHRYSEDLDFFSENDIDVMHVDVFLKSIKGKLGFSSIDREQSYNRNLFFLRFDDEVLKTEFTYYPFPRIEKGKTEFGVTVDSILDIAVNKVFTIYQKPRARDFIDLFCICRKENFSLADDLVPKARIKFDWHVDLLQLGSQLLQTTAVRDYPRMMTAISDEEWQNFFISEAKKLKFEIIE